VIMSVLLIHAKPSEQFAPYVFIIAHADGRGGGTVLTSVCLSVFCLHDISKSVAAMITKLVLLFCSSVL